MIILEIKNIREARITLSLITINIVLFFTLNNPIYIEYFYNLVLINSNVLDQFEIWRLLTSMFMHGDLSHLISNMFGLLLFGTYVEQSISKVKYLFIYIISGLIGNLFTLILYPSYIISYGASGALFGIIGVVVVIIYFEGDRFFLILATLYLLYFIASSFGPGINLWAHLFGLASGSIFALVNHFLKKKNLKE
ncbi:MAG: rhomboid family intramembrane serine protease [Candidatus Lokiarchaeota archaeon]|nr:rhomboid family intramembrane serine protease [Candidatus Lokiarchaeota archaeon]